MSFMQYIIQYVIDKVNELKLYAKFARPQVEATEIVL